nr:tetratricopeptide repeat protein [Bacillus piscicola]
MDKEDEALEWLLEVGTEDESFVRAQMLLADLYQLQGLDEAAEQRLMKALERAPDEPVLIAGIGDFYLERGDFNKSIPYLKQTENKGFEYPEGSVELKLAEAYSATGEFESALHYYEKGLQDKTDAESLFGYGYTALQVHHYSLAARKLQELKEMDPDFLSLYPYLIRAYEELGEIENALETAEQGMKVDEFNDKLFLEAGKLQLSLGRKEKAEGNLREALSLNPNNTEAALILLSSWAEEEDYDEIKELMTYLRDLGEEDIRFQWYYGKALYAEDNLIEARQAFEEAAPAYKDNGDFLQEYGRLLLELGNREKAVSILKEAAQLSPADESLAELIMSLEEDY